MLIEIILGERAPVADAPIQYSIVNEGFRATINGEAVFEPVAVLRDRVAKLKARDNLLGAVLARLGLKTSDADDAPKVVARLLEDRNEVFQQVDTCAGALTRIASAFGLNSVYAPDEIATGVLDKNMKLKARDNLLGAVLARLGADPGARESEAHAVLNRVFAAGTALHKIAHCLSLTATKPDELADQVLGQHAELTEALAKAQERIRELEADTERLHHACGVAKTHAKTLEGSRDSFIARADLAEAEVKALTEENAKLKAELQASAKALEAANAKRERDFNAALEAQREIKKLKAKLAEADLERMMAEATTDGMWTTLKAIEHQLRSRLPSP